MEASSLYMSLYYSYHGSMIINIPCCCYCACSHQGILELENRLKDAHIQGMQRQGNKRGQIQGNP
jgi:hypothetical protein